MLLISSLRSWFSLLRTKAAQLLFGPLQELSPKDLARAGDQAWPSAVDRCLLFIVTGLVCCVWWEETGLIARLLLSWVICGLALAVARALWVRPERLHLIIACFATLTSAVAFVASLYSLGYRKEVLFAMPMGSVLVSITVISWWQLVAFRRWQVGHRLQELNQRAEIERLAGRRAVAQIQPHFLFNTLSLLKHWTETNDPRAAPVLHAFSRYMRSVLTIFDHELRPLDIEIDLMRDYLAIMQARLGERLTVTLDVDSLPTSRIPPGILLTLVENAIHHGIEPSIRGGNITLIGRATEQLVVIVVADNGAGLLLTASEGASLARAREQLRQSFGGTASLELVAANPGCCATLKIPRKYQPT